MDKYRFPASEVRPIADVLRSISDKFNRLGGDGRLEMEVDWPVTVTLADGRAHKTTIRLRWTEDGPEVVDLDGQIQRLAQEITCG